MSLDWMLSLFAIVVVVWLYNSLSKSSELLSVEKQRHQKLKKDYDALERTLETRGRRLDVLLSEVSDVVLRVDRLGRVLGGNTQASDLFKFGESPKLPQSMLIFYRDSDWLNHYQKAVESLPKQITLPEMKIKGRVFLPRLAALGDNEALLLCMDITAYTQLQQKQKSLLENLMHDLKTPLTSLLGYARSIEAFADDEALCKEATAIIAQEAKHINDLMNSMLTLHQIEYQGDVSIEPCDILDVVHQVQDALQSCMQQKNISFEMQTELEELPVHMAKADCHRVLMNIIDNALKYSPNGSRIMCTVAERESMASIMIRDDGSGISDKHLHRITERFYRVDDVRGRVNNEGHGLGLAIVKETLERDGGSIKLKNHAEGGLLVSIQIPLYKA